MGHDLTLWAVRLSFVCYLAALAMWRWRWSWARVAWLAGVGCYVVHVWAAFTYVHHWSHTSAYVETARQTRELFGVESGSGLWFNYVFTAMWTGDGAWLLWRPESYRARARWIDLMVHGFLAFMFFNATVVFGGGAVRWLGAAASLAAIGIGLARWRARG